MHELRFILVLMGVTWSLQSTAVMGCGGTGGLRGLVDVPTGENTTLIYDPADGRVAVWSGHPTFGLTILEIISTRSAFIPEHAAIENFGGLFDIVSESKFFKLDSSGFAREGVPFELGTVLPTGLTPSQLLGDLKFSAVCGTGSAFLHIVPEPSRNSVLFPLLGFVATLGRRHLALEKTR